MSDEVSARDLKVYFVMLFWLMIPLVGITLVMTILLLIGIQSEFINSQVLSLPWGKLPVSNEARSLIMNLTMALIFALLLVLEIKVTEKLIMVVKKKFNKITSGGHDEN